MSRLSETAQDYGGVAGPWFLVYHGQLTEDSEVPVEVCAPTGLEGRIDGRRDAP